MTNTEKHFIYKQRFNNSFQDRFDKIIDSIKCNSRKFLSKNKWISTYLDHYEVYSLNRDRLTDKHSFTKAFDIPDIELYIYKDIKLKTIVFYEAIEIDNFDKYRKKILSKFADNQVFFSTKSKDDLKQKLSEVKQNLDVISWGDLFSLSYKKKIKKINDLISFINVSYIKTNESYFILKIEITLSEKFNSIFDQIVNSKDVSLSVPQYNTFLNILKTRRFISYETYINSLKCKNIEMLISDINQQVKLNVTKHLKGYFHNSKTSSILPSVEYYEVGNIVDFHKDSDLKQNFNTGFDGHYALKDNEIEIYFSNSSERKHNLIQIVKQKGHGSKERQGNDYSDYDKIETHYLLDSLAFPCVFRGIMKEQFENLNTLKRDIYDFVYDTKDNSIIKKILFFYYNSRYITLKQGLTQVLLTTKRFETEFTKQNIYLYTRHFELHKFEPRNRRIEKDDKNLLLRIIDELNYLIKSLDTKSRSTNEIFKTIEELNSYRTNYLLQMVSLFIAVLAFIFTFDKTKNLCISVFNYFSGQ